MKLVGIINQINLLAEKIVSPVTPLFDLAIRIYVAKVFFMSGLVKIQSWESTKMLFEYEYEVPFFSPVFAAYSGTIAELILPVMLVAGLFSRYTAVALFVFNYIAVIAYGDISPAGIKDHMLWGGLLLVTFFHGPGKLSLDYLLGRGHRTAAAKNSGLHANA